MKISSPVVHFMLRTCTVIAALLLGIVLLGLVACQETVNPNHQPSHRESLIFFNYMVRAPKLEPVASKGPRDLNDKFVGQTLRVLAWNHYIPPTIVEQFQDETGGQVIVDSYDNTTDLRDRIRAGQKCDLILTASFMTEQLHSEDRLLPVDLKNIPNVEHIGTNYRHPAFDPDLEFSVPFLWATMGIAYNYDALDKFPQSWGDLLEPSPEQILLLRNRVSLLPVPQRVYGIALIHLGYSIDTEKQDEVSAAAKLIAKQTQVLRFRFGRASMIEGLSTGELLMAQAYSNEAAMAQARNQSVRFCVPDEGSWVTIHCFALPKTADPKNKEMAEAFINFALEPTEAAEVVNYSLCASTIPGTQAYVRANVRLGPTYMLPSDPSKQFLQTFTPNIEDFRNRLWQELSAGMPMDQR